jgi:predicted acyltransferase
MSPAPTPRYLSLDVFRGLTIVLMIVVNTQGAGARPYDLLVHADWFGFTLADLVFPSFLFAMGTALAFTGKSGASESVFWPKTLTRTLILFGLGVLLYWFPFVQAGPDGHWILKPFADTRLMGVLQRIALCFALTAIGARYLGVRGLLVLCVALLAGYWGILLGFGPENTALTKTGNIGNSVDLWVLGKRHLYAWDEGFEPEGLLGTLPATVNVIVGFLTGRAVLSAGGSLTHLRQRVLWPLAGVGLLLCLSALTLQPLIPLSKKLWTPSFVLLTCGLDLMILSALAAWIEPGHKRPGTEVLTASGRNPLFAYLFSELLINVLNMVPVGHKTLWTAFCVDLIQPLVPGAAGAMICALIYTVVCGLPVLLLYRRGVIVRI